MFFGTTAVALTQKGLEKGLFELFWSNLSNHWVFVLVVSMIAILSLAALLLKGKLSIKLPGGAGVDIGSSSSNSSDIQKKDTKKDDKQFKNPVVPHANCPYAVDFKHVVTKTTYVVSKISEIRYKGCLSEQMGYVEEQFINIRTMYQKAYLEKLKEKTNGNENSDKYLFEDYRYYQAIIKLMIHDMEAVIRASFSNNHLTTYSPEEYRRYIDLKLGVVKGLEIDFIDSMYIGDWVITREEIFDIHKSQRDELQKIITDVYMRAQKIAHNKKEEIEGLEQELQDFLNYTVAGKINFDKAPALR